MTAVEIDELYQAMQAYVGGSVGAPAEARDAVNQPMIRHWCDAMGDENPVYTDAAEVEASVHGGIVAPPTMLQVWNMRGLKRTAAGPEPDAGGQNELMALLDGAGFTSVVATDCEQEYNRYLRVGDVLTETGVIESVSPLKRTALGDGYFVTTLRTYRDQAGEVVGTMRFRILKFRPRAGGADVAEAAPPEAAATPPPAASPAPLATTTPPAATPPLATTTPPPAAPPGPAATPAPPPPVPRPPVNRDTAFFWEGTRRGELRIQRCAACGALRHPPLPACSACGSFERDFVVASGRGRIYSFVVHHHPPVPGPGTPFVVVLVQLEEGTRLVGNLLDADPASVEIGREVVVEFVPAGDDLVLPQWRLAR